MVRESVWLTTASILACFKIEKPVDEYGNVVEPARKYFTNIVRYSSRSFLLVSLLILFRQPVPASFSCKIVPRSKEIVKIIGDLFISPE